MKSVSFTFKTKNKFATPLRGKLYKIHIIMLRRKEVGLITDSYPYQIFFNVAKRKTIKGDINQCTCESISLGGTFNSIDSAKAWLLMNVKTILQQYVLVDVKKTKIENKTNDNTY